MRTLRTRSQHLVITELETLLREYPLRRIDLSVASGVSEDAIRYWLRGLRSPSIDNLCAVLEVLGYRLRIERIPEE